MRIFRLPGEAYGFGPVLMNLPLIKTLNKVTEIALKGAVLNALGIYTRIDDGVFNPDTARLEPGAFWKVARNGGTLGPSIQRLPTATDPNLNLLVVQDQRQMIQAGMFDQQLPPDSQQPKSAAEVIARVKDLTQNFDGAFGRIVHDVILKIVPRVMELLHEQNILKGKRLQIDQLLVRLRVTSPLGVAFRAKQAENYANWTQACVAIAGDPGILHGVTPLTKGLAEMGDAMGVKADLIFTPTEQQAIQAEVARQVQAALAAQAKAGQQPPPPNGDPQQGQA